MTLKEQERLQEEEHLQELIEQLKSKYQELEQKVIQHKEEIKSFRTNFWQDISVNTDNWDDLLESFVDITQKSMTVAEDERNFRYAQSSLTQIKRLLNSPYFGRVDFIEKGLPNAEQIYIGTSSLQDDQTQDFLIYDWRAPVSSMFYDYPPGPAEYETPMGKIEGRIELKRQYLIRNGKMLSIFDAGIRIADEILQQVLGKNVDAQMRSIVATIQKEQNRIIREANKKIVIVQGAAGSGKTSVALQRIAFLLYKYRNTLTADNMILFSPNPLFKNYISNVLPELGEENIQQSTLHEYVEAQLGNQFQLEHPYTHLESILLSVESPNHLMRTEGIRYKGSIAFYQSMEEYVKWLNQEGMLFQPLTFRKNVLISAEEMKKVFYQFSALRLSIRVELLKEWMLKKLKEIEKVERKREWVLQEIESLDRDDYHQAFQSLKKKQRYSGDSFDDYQNEEIMLRRMVVQKLFKPLYKWVNQLRFIDLLAIYKQLFVQRERFLHRENQDHSLKHIDQISEDTLRRLHQATIPYEDTTPLLLLKQLTEGFRRYLAIQYVVIDEAQDYTPFQLRLLAKLFPRGKWTMLGDLNQAIWAHQSQLTSNPFVDQIDDKDVEVYRLTKSYRSTKEIIEFTKSILVEETGYEAFDRHGEVPKLIRAVDEERIYRNIEADIKDMQEKGMQTIAIICKTEQESLEVYRQLSKKLNLQLIKKNVYTYKEGVVVIPSYLAKGLEFDAVIVFNASQKTYGKESERNLLYTVCTRALHLLHIYYMDQPSPFLPN